MRLHREGTKIILVTIALVAIVNFLSIYFIPNLIWLKAIVLLGTLVFLGLVLNFFRNPIRGSEDQPGLVIAPADGKVVVIEKTNESEYFKEERIQISIFMSPINVHVNRNPISGDVKYEKYHPGKYLVAWHPKSSTENERTTVVIGNKKTDILVRQIAGAVARRIVNYAKVGQQVKQGQEFGFIKFGSRVDVFLPLDSKINVEIGQMTVGGETVLADISAV